ncbi:DNA-binding protein [Actinopolyspora erythraea]|uniref:DNA-binding protein n=1 Tax=Actinopolyspora erythraea TaxID=414996 RepID=A0A099D202_9ACTN|nr:helix-turn-helix domain-containing protein [Actinopolyspora erythraea]ASU80753.1 DNA-binding protein [Actinopolyspora erythraea]KGI80233.1 excisionase [Actinopolyspora erythraea]
MFNSRGGATAEAPRFYSVEQVAQLFGVSSMTLYRAIAGREFPAIRIRGRLIVPAKAVDEMVDTAIERNSTVDAADYVPEAAA